MDLKYHMNDLIKNYQSKNYKNVMIICEKILKSNKDISKSTISMVWHYKI